MQLPSSPVFARFSFQAPSETPDFYVNPIGAKMRKHFMPAAWQEDIGHIQVNEDLFEWIDLLEAVAAATKTFTMAYLGAGFGRWLVNGACAARQRNRGVYLVGVEAEDTHHRWMVEHFHDNGVSTSEYLAVDQPVSDTEKDVFFTVGHADEWYGQAMLPTSDTGFGHFPSASVETKRAIGAAGLLREFGRIDALHADLQGEEKSVFPSCIDELDRRVARVHIGTHSREIDRLIEDLFQAHGWVPSFRFPCATRAVSTPFGPVDFQDGAQSWINPRLRSPPIPASVAGRRSDAR